MTKVAKVVETKRVLGKKEEKNEKTVDRDINHNNTNNSTVLKHKVVLGKK